jgi:hypothetical protein
MFTVGNLPCLFTADSLQGTLRIALATRPTADERGGALHLGHLSLTFAWPTVGGASLSAMPPETHTSGWPETICSSLPSSVATG